MDSHVADQNLGESDTKRQKLNPDDEKESESHYETLTDSEDESEDENDVRLFNEEFEKHRYDFDETKVGKIKIYHPVHFNQNEHTEPPDTDGDMVERLSKIALEKYNGEHNKNFEFVKAIKANWNLGGGYIYYITLEVKDKDSPNSDPIPFHAQVAHPWGDIVLEVYPKP